MKCINPFKTAAQAKATLYLNDTASPDGDAIPAQTANKGRMFTCKALIRIASPTTGIIYKVPAILDTGGSQSAITAATVERVC